MLTPSSKLSLIFTFFILASLSLNLGCSKDSDLLADSVLEDPNNVDADKENIEIFESGEENEPDNELRTTSFFTTNDAHVQSGKGFNQSIIRLEEDQRVSYLMFDLSPIGQINGEITKAELQFTVDGDDGNGNISVFKAKSSDWTEGNLTQETAPTIEIELGSILKEYKIGTTEVIPLDITYVNTENTTLILRHKNGNDLAFASKEHETQVGPKLVVTYEVLKSAEAIEDTNEQEEEKPDANQAPVAIADATPTSGKVPLVVNFMANNSTDDVKIVSFNWDFKDDTSGTEINPEHTFTEVGVYIVALTVTDESGLKSTDTVTISVTETDNQAPEAIIDATPKFGEAPLKVSFDGGNSTDDKSITSYAWDLKDGSKANAVDFEYTYDSPGEYEVELEVSDENGLTDTTSVLITVTEPENKGPIAVVSANPTNGAAPLNVQFTSDNSSDDNGITSYFWDFKDGTNASTANPSHQFENPGTYEVELTVKDAQELMDKKTITIVVSENQNTPPVAVATASPLSGKAPLTVQFLGDSSSDNSGIKSYSWDFRDGSTAAVANPSHTFIDPGVYTIILTVKDAQGLSSSQEVQIDVEEENTNGGGNVPPGFYVATNGNSSNNGTSPSSPWSLEHAFNVAKAGDVIYVKSGNYGNKQLRTYNNGNSGAPIKFIGYKSIPGDITSVNGSTFNYGEIVSANSMPLLQGSNGLGTAITIHDRYIEIENFQITGYAIGVQTINIATNSHLKNIIVTNVGNQSNSNSYTGVGFKIEGNNTLIEDSFVLNAGAEAFNLSDSDYSRVNHCKVYANNNGNPTDYYFLLTGGTNNTVVENSLAERLSYLSHGGHGFDMKDLAKNNTFKNCTAKRTSFELNFSGVQYNTIEDCKIYGVDTSSSNWHAVLAIFNGANNNLIKNMYIQDTWAAISWGDYDDGFVGPGGDRDEVSMGYDNTFDGLVIQNTNRVLNVGGGTNFAASAERNTLQNFEVTNFNFVAVTQLRTKDITIQNCRFINGQNLVVETDGQYAPYSKFNVRWINNTWSGVNFNPPN